MEQCNKYQERISAFIDGLLPEEERLELMEHMADCPACQAYFEDQTAIHDALSGLEADAPEGFAEAVMDRVRRTKQDVPEKKVVAFPRWRRWVATAACCAVAVLGVMGLQGKDVSGLPSAAQDAVSYSVVRSQTESADAAAAAKTTTETTQADSKPVPQAESAPADDVTALTAPAAAAPLLEDAARTEEEKSAENPALSCTLTTASPLAAQWVTEELGENWQAGRSYELTADQFDALRALLEDAGEACAVEYTEAGGFWLKAAE